MKKFLSIIMVFALLFVTLSGCKQEDNEKADINADNSVNTSEVSQKGYASEKELIDGYRECVNKSDITDEFWDAFDYTGYCAYWITEESREITIDEAYNVLVDLDKGTEYIRNNHIAFCEKWKNENNSEFKIDDLDEIRGINNERKNPKIRKYWSLIFVDYKEYTPLEVVDTYEEDIWRSSYGYCEYSVSVVYNRDEGSVSLNIRYIVRDGRYYWILANETLGGYGG